MRPVRKIIGEHANSYIFSLPKNPLPVVNQGIQKTFHSSWKFTLKLPGYDYIWAG